MPYRTDRNNNPIAFTVNIAEQAGLKVGVDYVQGDPFFDGGHQYFTAKLLGDPVTLSIHVIDELSFYTQSGQPRWIYIAMPNFVWKSLDNDMKKLVVGFMYHKEGGSVMSGLFVKHLGIGVGDSLGLKDSL